MNGFAYRDGALHVEDVAVTDLADNVGTPFYCYSAARLRHSYTEFAGAFAGLEIQVCYAVKANSNQAVITLFATLGAGADVVSEGEMRRALAAGVPAEKMVFSGVGKTRAELSMALRANCGQFNVESEAELQALSDIAAGLGKTATIVLRVNPDVDADTHHKISTGRAGDKFGIELDRIRDVYAWAGSLPGITPAGLAVHIGSQLTRLDPFRDAFERISALVRDLRVDGQSVDRVDLGGGLGIVYNDEIPPVPTDYAEIVRDVFGDLGVALTFEPGRRLTGEAGILVTRVIYIKESGGRRFAVVDAAMNDLIRPTLYDAWHDIDPVTEPAGDALRAPVDIVGPVCETGDVLAIQRDMPALAPGDLLAVRAAGAYGAVMSSSYNSRLLVPETMVDGAQYAVIRPRPDYDTLIAQDVVPEWIAGG
jgi:diaminopimelate decarboxylase